MAEAITAIFVLLLALFIWRVMKRSEGARQEAKTLSRPTLEMEKPQDVSVEMLGDPSRVDGGGEEDHGHGKSGNAGQGRQK